MKNKNAFAAQGNFGFRMNLDRKFSLQCFDRLKETLFGGGQYMGKGVQYSMVCLSDDDTTASHGAESRMKFSIFFFETSLELLAWCSVSTGNPCMM